MTHTDTQDQHVREYYLYHDEQTKFFDDLASTRQPDAGLDEAAALNWCEQMHDLTGTWNADVWSEKGWW